MTNQKEVWGLRLGSGFAIGLLLATLLFSVPVSAQQGDDLTVQEDTTESPTGLQGSPAQPPRNDQNPSTVTGNVQSPPTDLDATSSQDPNKQKPISLENGLPLKAVMSPLRWGHLSLLSAGLLSAYTSNVNAQPGTTGPVGAQATYANALVVYSIDHAKSQLNLQYMPTGWAAAGHLQSDFTAHALDFETSHRFSRNWTLGVYDQFQYSPHKFFWTSTSFAPDFTNNSATDNPFLLIGRKALQDTLGLNVNRTVNGKDQLSLALDEHFIRLSSTSDPLTSTPAFPTDEEFSSSATATWNRTLSPRSTFSLNYQFRNEREQLEDLNTNFQNVQIGFSRRLWPSFTVSLKGGPGWSSRGQKTLEGGVSLFKTFRKGGIAAEFQRSTNFSGIISSSYNNRYNVSLTQQVRTRWNFDVTYSYVQQEFINARQKNASIAYVSAGYRLSRMWSLYSTYYYINPSGSTELLTRRQVVAGGIRWAWTPSESNHN